MTRCAVYSHFNAAGDVLYIGMSGNPTRRLYEHKCRADWAADVARSEIIWFDTREAAAAYERDAIAQAKPNGNSSGTASARVPATTILGRWMQGQPARAMADWAKAFEVSRPYLYSLLDGTRFPSLQVAVSINRATCGAVPLVAWPNLSAIIDAAGGAMAVNHGDAA